MKNWNISPEWQFSPVCRYEGKNRRDTRRVRVKIYNYMKSHKRDKYLPTHNSWQTPVGLTITPVWVREITNNYYDYYRRPLFSLLIHDGTKLLGSADCYAYQNFWSNRIDVSVCGKRYYAELRVKSEWESAESFCHQYYREYEKPTKDLTDFDDWRCGKCPCFVAAQIIEIARYEWRHYRGTARDAFEAGIRSYRLESLEQAAKREYNARRVSHGNQSASFNRRQLRALGFVA